MLEEAPDEGHEESALLGVCTLLLSTTAHSACTLTSLNTETGLASCSTGSAPTYTYEGLVWPLCPWVSMSLAYQSQDAHSWEKNDSTDKRTWLQAPEHPGVIESWRPRPAILIIACVTPGAIALVQAPRWAAHPCVQQREECGGTWSPGSSPHTSAKLSVTGLWVNYTAPLICNYFILIFRRELFSLSLYSHNQQLGHEGDRSTLVPGQLEREEITGGPGFREGKQVCKPTTTMTYVPLHTLGKIQGRTFQAGAGTQVQ